MKREIECSKHAIEEYLKDNPRTLNPVRKLQSKLRTFLTRLNSSERTNISWFISNEDKTNKLRCWDEVFIYIDYFIITYYRLIPREWRLILNRNKKMINTIIDIQKRHS